MLEYQKQLNKIKILKRKIFSGSIVVGDAQIRIFNFHRMAHITFMYASFECIAHENFDISLLF